MPTYTDELELAIYSVGETYSAGTHSRDFEQIDETAGRWPRDLEENGVLAGCSLSIAAGTTVAISAGTCWWHGYRRTPGPDTIGVADGLTMAVPGSYRVYYDGSDGVSPYYATTVGPNDPDYDIAVGTAVVRDGNVATVIDHWSLYKQSDIRTATTAGGGNSEIQYNNGGVFGGSPRLTYDGVSVGFSNPLGDVTGTIGAALRGITMTVYQASTGMQLTAASTAVGRLVALLNDYAAVPLVIIQPNNNTTRPFYIDAFKAVGYMNCDIEFPDEKTIYFGTARDAWMWYNGTDLMVNPDAVGAGILNIAGTCKAVAFSVAAYNKVWFYSTSYYLQFQQGPNILEMTSAQSIQFNAQNGWIYLWPSISVRAGAASDYAAISAIGNLSFVGGAGFYPRRVSQNDEPAAGIGATQIDLGEMLLWWDADAALLYLMYRDATGGIKKIGLT